VFRRIVLVCILLVSTAIFVVALSMSAREHQRRPEDMIVGEGPDDGTESGDSQGTEGPDKGKFRHEAYENGEIKYAFNGEKAFPHKDGSYDITSPEIIIHGANSEGRNVAKVRLTARHGKIHMRKYDGRQEMDSVKFTGDVFMESLEAERPAKAWFDDIFYNRAANLVTTKGPVKIENADYDVDGIGFEGDTDFREITIAKPETVLIHRFEKAFGKRGGGSRHVRITCDGPLVFNRKDRLAKVTGNVVAVEEPVGDDTIRLTATRYVTIYFKGDAEEKENGDGLGGMSFDRLVAVGNVVMTQGDRNAYGDTISYALDRLSVMGSPGRVTTAEMELESPEAIDLLRGDKDRMDVRVDGGGRVGMVDTRRVAPERTRTTKSRVTFERKMRFSSLDENASQAVFSGNVEMVQRIVGSKKIQNRITGEGVRLGFMRHDQGEQQTTDLEEVTADGPRVQIKWGTITSDGNSHFNYDRPKGLAVFKAAEDKLSRLIIGEEDDSVLVSRSHYVRFDDKGLVTDVRGEGPGSLKYRPADAEQPEIDSKWTKRYEFGEEKGVRVAKFFGDVRANQSNGSILKTDQLNVYLKAAGQENAESGQAAVFADLEPYRYVGKGNVHYDSAADNFKAWARQMDYRLEAGRELIDLKGQVKVSRPGRFDFEGDSCSCDPKTREASSDKPGTLIVVRADKQTKKPIERIRVDYAGSMLYKPRADYAEFLKDVIVSRFDLNLNRALDRVDCQKLRLAFVREGEGQSEDDKAIRWVDATRDVVYVRYHGLKKAKQGAPPISQLPSRLVIQGKKFFSHAHYSPDNLYVFCDSMRYDAEGAGRGILKPEKDGYIVVLEKGLVTYNKNMEIQGRDRFVAKGTPYMKVDMPGKPQNKEE